MKKLSLKQRISVQSLVVIVLVCLAHQFGVSIPDINAQSYGPIDGGVSINWNAAIALPATTGALTAVQMFGLGEGNISAPATLTTPSATAICAMFPNPNLYPQGLNWDWYVKNTSGGSDAITIGAGTGVTLVGTMTVAAAAVRRFRVSAGLTCSSTPAVRIYSLGTGAF